MIQESARAFAPNAPWRDDAADLRPRVHAFDPRALRQFAPLPAEFAALERAGVAPGPLHAALAEAERAGVSPYDALATSGAIDDDDLLEALARGVGVDICGPQDREGPPIDADGFEGAMRSGHLLTVDVDGGTRLVVRASGDEVGQLAAFRRGQFRDRAVALATPRDFADVVTARAGPALALRAAEGPASTCPELTVARGLPEIGRAARIATFAALAGLAAAVALVDAVGVALLAVASLMFATLNGFRLFLLAAPGADAAPRSRAHDRDLPVYTVMVALLHEGAVVPTLLAALDRLDYPRAKLDVKILVEEGDDDTLGALDRCRPRSGVEVLVLPPGGPRTKPRALNAGLLAARGEFLTVYDAEDRPDPNQLRIAVETFRRGPTDLACLQARLAIDNLKDGWLTRQFAIEYAALFDVVLPALSRLRLPIPLGGTSNHFRVDRLRAIGGWDAGNVTEDADLGLRLARLGLTTRTIASTTWEEAPTTTWPWVKQRTRWMKGFMVTSIVHGRRAAGSAPAQSPVRYLVSQLLIGGVAFTALSYPLMMAFMGWSLVSGLMFEPAQGVTDAAVAGLHAFNLILGFSAAALCCLLGIARRCPDRLALDLIATPFYWALVGFAAWRAAFQIVGARATDWEKTEHGVSKRRASMV